MTERPSWLKPKEDRADEDDRHPTVARPPAKNGFTRRASEKPAPKATPNGFKHRQPKEPAPERAPEPPPPRYTSTPKRGPYRPKQQRHEKPRPVGLDSTCLGLVTVLRATDKGIQVTGGDTTGENWLPRSYILDGSRPGDLDRDADVGDEGELWLPQWLADKIPW